MHTYTNQCSATANTYCIPLTAVVSSKPMSVNLQDQPSTTWLSQSFINFSTSNLQAALQGHGSGSTQAHRTIELLMVSYLYDAEEDAFLPIPDMPPELPLQLHNAISQLQAIAVSGKLSTCPSLLLESSLSLMPLCMFCF